MKTVETLKIIEAAAEATAYLERVRELDVRAGVRLYFPDEQGAHDAVMQFAPDRGISDTNAHPLTAEEADTIQQIAAAVLERGTAAAEQLSRELVAAVRVIEG